MNLNFIKSINDTISSKLDSFEATLTGSSKFAFAQIRNCWHGAALAIGGLLVNMVPLVVFMFFAGWYFLANYTRPNAE